MYGDELSVGELFRTKPEAVDGLGMNGTVVTRLVGDEQLALLGLIQLVRGVRLSV